MKHDVVVRAVTFFTGKVNSLPELEEEIACARDILGRVERAITSRGYGVFTKRISLPGVTEHLASRLLDYVDGEVLISTGYSPLLKREDVVELVVSGIYVPILHVGEPSLDSAREYSRVFHEASRVDPLAATRISVGFHDAGFQTPYFPDSSSPGQRAVGLAFLYPKYLLRLLESGVGLEAAFKETFAELHEVVDVVKKVAGLPVVVDYSLSPWMDHSVAELYSKGGHSLLGPGALYFTWLLNHYIDLFSDKSLKTGFSEVMLPYAEDSLLVDYGARGLLKARDFLMLASACVAGVDMLIVPEDVEALAELTASTMALAYTRLKKIALRVIPVQGKPGDTVDLKRFGRVPVLPY